MLVLFELKHFQKELENNHWVFSLQTIELLAKNLLFCQNNLTLTYFKCNWDTFRIVQSLQPQLFSMFSGPVLIYTPPNLSVICFTHQPNFLLIINIYDLMLSTFCICFEKMIHSLKKGLLKINVQVILARLCTPLGKGKPAERE